MQDSQKLFVRGLRISWDCVSPDSYLRGIEALSELDELNFRRPVTFFVGENGSGKSTLLEAIAVAWGFNAEGGTKNYRFSTYDSHSELSQAVTLIRGSRKPENGYFLRAESFYNVATAEEEYARGPGGRPQHFHQKSHGESFLAAAQNYFRPRGFYLMDEPEAALSPQRQLALLFEIAECAKAGAQFIIATHSPILLGLPDAELLSFDNALQSCAYEDTDSYQITRMFVNHREQVLRNLMNEESN